MKKTAFFLLLFMFSSLTIADPVIVAHRMGAMERDENTLEALKECAALGMKAFETDIHITKDDQLIVTHDGSLKRRCGSEVNVEEMTLEEIRQYKTKEGNPLPTLREILRFLKGKGIAMQLEIKSPPKLERLKKLVEVMVRELKEEEFTGDDLLVISFVPEALKLTREAEDGIKTGLLCSVGDDKAIKLAKENGCSWISADISNATKSFVDKAHKEGFKLALWTIRNKRDNNLARAFEVEAIVTDIPKTLTEAEKK